MPARRQSTPIRDAASLILVRGGGGDRRVLLGRRAASSRFMPGKFVFPGGALQTEDFAARAVGELDSASVKKMGVRGNAARAEALAKAAIRETLEETGLMVGAPGDVGGEQGDLGDISDLSELGELGDPGWRMVAATGLRPRLDCLTYLGRAVTPPGLPLRFNARFFMAPAEAAVAAYGRATDSDELGDLRWARPAAWREFPLVSVTAYILEHFAAITRRAAQGQAFDYRHRHARAEVKWR